MPMIPDVRINKTAAHVRAPVGGRIGNTTDYFHASRVAAPKPKPAIVPVVAALMQEPEAQVGRAWLISPSGIYVARKSHFEFRTDLTSATAIIDALFDELPLAEHGWNSTNTFLTPLGKSRWELRKI
jgi:hypothetical protein